MKDLLYICNPVAGRGRTRRELARILDFYNSYGFLPRVYMTGTDRDLSEALRGLTPDTALVCSGGDGMLNILVGKLRELGLSVPIGYLPMGTTNDFSKNIGLTGSFEDILAASVFGKAVRLDAGSLLGRSFIYVAGFGNFTNISYKTPQFSKNLLGYLAYILEGAMSIGDIKPFHVSIEAAGEELEGDYVLGLVTNSVSVAGLKSMSGAMTRLDDGLLELTLIKMPGSLRELRELLSSYLSSNVSSELIEYRQGRDFVFRSEKLCWTLDGEFGGCYDTTHINVLPGAFSIRRPVVKKDGKLESKDKKKRDRETADKGEKRQQDRKD